MHQVTDAYGKTTTSLFNAAGQVTSVTDPLGHSAGYEYDETGRLWKVKDALNRVTVTYIYNDDSAVNQEIHSSPASVDYVVRFEYDNLKRAIHSWDEDSNGILLRP